LVGATIAERRVKLRDEITIAAMNVDAVEAGLCRAAGGLPKGSDNSSRTHLAWRRSNITR
jgi:hypothetical protein